VSFLLILTISVALGWINPNEKWISEKHIRYYLNYTNDDKSSISEYKSFTNIGIRTVEDFFGNSFLQDFEIYIHPNRQSLNKQWQTDWNMPNFKSECWMVASGVNTKLDILSPKTWDSLACEHSSKNKLKIQRIFTHELVHVYHGQHNISPDFSNTSGIDWFIEGLATFVSGQCDSIRISDVKTAILSNKAPLSLDQFWTGNLRYGQSGTMIMYISNHWNQEKLFELLQYNNKTDILKSLKITEDELILKWESYITSL